jgi:hypothetical protein
MCINNIIIVCIIIMDNITDYVVVPIDVHSHSRRGGIFESLKQWFDRGYILHGPPFSHNERCYQALIKKY